MALTSYLLGRRGVWRSEIIKYLGPHHQLGFYWGIHVAHVYARPTRGFLR